MDNDLETTEVTDVLESEEFFNLMQAYRQASFWEQEKVIGAFEAVKQFIRDRF